MTKLKKAIVNSIKFLPIAIFIWGYPIVFLYGAYLSFTKDDFPSWWQSLLIAMIVPPLIWALSFWKPLKKQNKNDSKTKNTEP
jgi:hypothetical protein